MNGWVRDRLRGDRAAPRKFKRVDSYWRSELQKPGARDETFLLFDLDDADEDAFEALHVALSERTAIRTWTETPSGYHVVTAPFDYTDLAVDVEYEVKTDGSLFVEYLAAADGDDGR